MVIMTILRLFFLSMYICSIRVLAASVDQWRDRTIYQVVTDRFALSNGTNTTCNAVEGLYCGGSWQGIKEHLDYIQGMNFDAIWISPVVGQLPQRTGDGESYTAYWQQNLYALNTDFGSEDDLKELIAAVHDRGMYLMLDIVVNHMGYAGLPQYVDYSVFRPFDDKRYFHNYCTVNDPTNSTNREQCWLGDSTVPLVDLRTEDQDVRDLFGEWISGMVRNYSIDGLRIDTALNVEPSFFEDFVTAAGIFATGETMDGDNKLACQWAETIGSILNYPIYYPLTRAFSSPNGNINDLVTTIYTTQVNCNNSTAFGMFSENHDVPRFAQMTDDMSQAKNVITYTLMSDGIPIIYQGQEQHMSGGVNPYRNRSPVWEAGFDTDAVLYKHVAALTQARQAVIKTSPDYTTYMTDVIYEDYHTFAMRKGVDGSQVITVLNNNGESCNDFMISLHSHGYKPGTEVTEILSCTDLKVNKTGYLDVPMGQGLPKVIYPTKLLVNSTICGMGKAVPSETSVPTAYSTTVNGHPTAVSTSATVTHTPTTRTSSAAATHSKLALGAAGQLRFESLRIMPLIFTILAFCIGCALLR